jgi:hypothetical protein
MSAKGRVRKGPPAAPAADNPHEYNPTPRTAVLPLLATDLVQLPGGTWIEPCAGDGAIVRAVREVRADVRFRLFEVDDRHEKSLRASMRSGDELTIGDFVMRSWRQQIFDVCIFNPPFTLTMPMLHAALDRARWVAMLQRVNWFGSQFRGPWLRTHCPDMLELEERPSFRAEGGSDATEYAWFVWGPDQRVRRVGRLAILEPWKEAA